MLGDWLVVSQVIPVNPAAAVRGPTHVVTTGATPVLSPAEARRLLEAIDTGTLAGLRDRALVSVRLYSVARVSAVIGMRRQDYFRQECQGWLRLHEKGGKRHDVPAHHRAAEALDNYVEAAELEEPKATLFQSVEPAGRPLTGRALSRRLVLAMIKRRAAAADLPPSTCCHTFRATGITASLSKGGTLEHAQQIAGHASPKTTKLYDRTADTITVDEIGAHRDLGGGRPARRRSPRDGRSARRDGRAARCRVRHAGFRVASDARSRRASSPLSPWGPLGAGLSSQRRSRATGFALSERHSRAGRRRWEPGWEFGRQRPKWVEGGPHPWTLPATRTHSSDVSPTAPRSRIRRRQGRHDPRHGRIGDGGAGQETASADSSPQDRRGFGHRPRQRGGNKPSR